MLSASPNQKEKIEEQRFYFNHFEEEKGKQSIFYGRSSFVATMKTALWVFLYKYILYKINRSLM